MEEITIQHNSSAMVESFKMIRDWTKSLITIELAICTALWTKLTALPKPPSSMFVSCFFCRIGYLRRCRIGHHFKKFSEIRRFGRGKKQNLEYSFSRRNSFFSARRDFLDLQNRPNLVSYGELNSRRVRVCFETEFV